MLDKLQKHELGYYEVKNKPTENELNWYLYHKGSNYVKNKSTGKDAHNARVELECLLDKQDIGSVLNLWRSLGQVGIGRDITVFLTK